jgi:hypothetical protein
VDVDELGPRLDATASEAIQLDGMAPGGVLAVVRPGGPERLLALWDVWWHRETSDLEWEVEAYQRAKELGITLPFVGHLTENGGLRVIGYLLQPVAVRQAVLGDADKCRQALGKLHRAGMALGEITRSSFLVRDGDGGVLLQALHMSYETSESEVLEQEMALVETVLVEAQNEPLLEEEATLGKWDEDLNQQVFKIGNRDGLVHPLVRWEARKEGNVTISQAEHLALLMMLQRQGNRWTNDDMAEAIRQRQQNGGRWVPLVIGEYRTEEQT